MHDVTVVDDVNALGQRQRRCEILLVQHDGLAGQGSPLAITAAYVLAGELARAGGRSYADAFQRYESLCVPTSKANKEPQKV